MLRVHLRIAHGLANCVLILCIFISATAHGDPQIFERKHGWKAIGTQADPFDQTAIDIVVISKDDFVFDCATASLVSDRNAKFDTFKIWAALQYQVDGKKVVKQDATYSTIYGGRDGVSDNRFFSFRMDQQDVQNFKRGLKLTVAAKHYALGWINKDLDLMGFTAAYTEMCE